MPDFSILRNNLLNLSEENVKTFDLSLELGQNHLFEDWDIENLNENHLQLLKEIKHCDEQYPGGLKAYIKNALALLRSSKLGENPYEGYVPKIPEGKNMTFGDAEFREMENIGLKNITRTGFVLVAGGLGERLGYSGIKIALPSETTTGKSFIQLYIETLLAYQRKANDLLGENREIPLAIMTSGDTNDKTIALLKNHNNFGMSNDQITIMKQEKVPSLSDNQAKFVLNEDNKFSLETKPHGHGDVHVLLHSKGVVKKWLDSGIEWMNFIQDTNGIIFKAILPALGVSHVEGFEVNTITVPRRAGEAAGGIVRLEKSNGEGMTINVEYNQLAPLLMANGQPEGDVADETGYSPYPGNTNVLIFKLKPYVETLSKSGGMIPEFVNPKYADEKRESFKKPTRLECMMQDYPKLLDAGAKVGFTNFERWVCFSAVKNNLSDAKVKSENNLPAECASTGEMDIYHLHRESLRQVGVEIDTIEDTVAGIALTVSPRIVLTTSFAATLDELSNKVKGLSLSPSSTLIVEGDHITLENLTLDGALDIKAGIDTKLNVKNLNINNRGFKIVELGPDEKATEELKIRGYKMVKSEQRIIEEMSAGDYTVES